MAMMIKLIQKVSIRAGYYKNFRYVVVAPRWCDHNIQITNEKNDYESLVVLRLSRDEDAELNSLNNQRNILVEYANANNRNCRESF